MTPAGDGAGALPDLLGPGLRVLIVGFNPGLRSAEVGHYYAGRNNAFWALLHESGLTPRKLHWSEDALLPGMGIGLTDLARSATRGSAEVAPAEYRAGARRFGALVRELRPRVVAFNGKGVYHRAAGVASAPWGLQATRLVEGVDDFVLPSPSGLARLSFAEKAAWYTALREHVDRLDGTSEG